MAKKIITITNRKGGTAKSETARAIAGGLLLKGYKVLMVDLDAQRNLSLATGADASKPTIYNIINGDCGAAEGIQHTAQGDIITASPLLYGLDFESVYVLKKLLGGLEYDYIIIDTAPAFNKLTVAATVAADGLIIPTQADIYALTALRELNEEIKSLREYNENLKICGVCITRYANNRVSKDMQTALKTVCELIGTKLYKTPIRENVAIKESATECRSIYQYAPRSNGAKDYTELVNEFLADNT